MAVDREVARVNFSAFVTRALASARARGYTDEAIREHTGVGPSTFHRWRRGDWGRDWPELQKVIDFCRGLGFDEDEAFAALGLTGSRTPTRPDPMDPDMREILRRLADPNVSASEKHAIRLMLRSLAALAEQLPPKPSVRPSRRRPRKAS